MLPLQLTAQPVVIHVHFLHIVPQQPPVVDQQHRKKLLRDVQGQLTGRYRLGLGPQQHRHLAAGLQDGVLHVPQVGDPLASQLLQKLVHRHAVVAHGPLLELPVTDDDGRFPADQGPEPPAAEADIA